MQGQGEDEPHQLSACANGTGSNHQPWRPCGLGISSTVFIWLSFVMEFWTKLIQEWKSQVFDGEMLTALLICSDTALQATVFFWGGLQNLQ